MLKDREVLTSPDLFESLRRSKDKSRPCYFKCPRNRYQSEYAGDELQGLARTFLCAGANSLILTLWPIDPKAAIETMIEFYSNQKNGSYKATSLQKAQMTMRDR